MVSSSWRTPTRASSLQRCLTSTATSKSGVSDPLFSAPRFPPPGACVLPRGPAVRQRQPFLHVPPVTSESTTRILTPSSEPAVTLRVGAEARLTHDVQPAPGGPWRGVVLCTRRSGRRRARPRRHLPGSRGGSLLCWRCWKSTSNCV